MVKRFIGQLQSQEEAFEGAPELVRPEEGAVRTLVDLIVEFDPGPI